MKRGIEKYNLRALSFVVIASCAALTGCGKPSTGELLRLVPFLIITLSGIAYLAGRTGKIIIVYCSSLAVLILIFWGSIFLELDLLGNEGFYYLLVMQTFVVYAGITHGIVSFFSRKYTSRVVRSLVIPFTVSVVVVSFYVTVVILNAEDNGEIGELTVWLFGSPIFLGMLFGG